MGYEIGASMGVKMAQPDVEEYTVVGDAGFQMLNSELGTIMQERIKTNILVFDNCGFGCINNLEMTHGIGSLATEFRYTDGVKPTGNLIPMDYTKIGEAYGMKTYACRSAEELRDAILDSRKQTVACLFDLKIVPKTMTDGYDAWWNVGIAMESKSESVREAADDVKVHRAAARQY
jgi:3D-(3,5/4)-trihydroxycyclohexane-1,2-dione acylhydrolase (decyclizing)